MKRKVTRPLSLHSLVSIMIVSAFAGCSTPTYRCSRDDQCTSSGELPKCIIEQPMSTGVCAEANLQCVSGYRYSRSAPNAGMCVPAVLDAGVDAGQDVVSTDMPTVGLDVLGTDADVPNMTPDQQPVDGGVATECDTDPGRPNCSCILQVRPPAMPILAGPLGVCDIRVIRPLSQRLSPGRAVRFKAELGSSVSNPRVDIVSIRANSPPMNLALPLTIMAGSGAVLFTETEAATYAIRWRITGECNGRQVSTPDTTLALPRPYRVADCVAGPLGCSSPIEPVAATTDLDGDGRSDLVVGQQKLITVSTATNLGAAVTTEVCLQTSSDRLGRNIEAVGDLDGDGVSDFLLSGCVVGDPSANCSDVAIAYGGGPAGISSVRMLAPISPRVGLSACSIGATLAAGADFNQDGYADALVGTPCNNGGMLHVVLGSPSRASELRALNTDDRVVAAIAAEPMFARGIAMIGRRGNGVEVATLSTASVRGLNISPTLVLTEAYQLSNPYTPYDTMRWQGLLGLPVDAMVEPGAVSVSNTSASGLAGIIDGLRYIEGVRVPTRNVLVNGFMSNDLVGRFLAGPIDLNNDGRGDSLSVGGGTGAGLYVLGGGPGTAVAAPIISRGVAQQIRALASIGNVSSPLLDSYAVNIVDAASSVIRICQRNDGVDSPILPMNFGFTCPNPITLRLASPATIAGR